MTTTWGNVTRNTSSFSNVNKSDPALSKQLLEIGDGFNLLIDATNKLEIQAAISSTTWSNSLKS